MNPVVILLVSGKRKCGKDYISEKLLNILGSDKATIVRISAPIKKYYAESNNLNLSELMSDNKYKENYRIAMINWSDKVRAKEPGYFCKAACETAEDKAIWIVSDIRRKTDIKWFSDNFGDKIRSVRIEVDNTVRLERGWIFTAGVDDVQSECDLDDYKEWNLTIRNVNEESCNKGITDLLELVK